jgi:hypothetical protein
MAFSGQLAARLQSHYVIQEGQIVWAGPWSDQEVQAGRSRREAYFAKDRKPGLRARLSDGFNRLLRK